MNKKIVYVYLPNTLADWEPGFVISELNTGRFFKEGAPRYSIKTFALTKEPIITMGGLRILPDLTVNEVTSENSALMLLPGSDIWLESGQDSVLQKAKDFLNNGVLVAAICGATLALGKVGILDSYTHTSNDLNFLKSVCPEYKGEAKYRDQDVVIDNNLITASGVAPLEFAYQIFKKLDVFSNDTLEAWYGLYHTHDPQYYFKLVQSLPHSSH
jgi:putative intracellular protease/amidase